MKFVNEEMKVVDHGDPIDLKKEDDQLGIKETKPVEEHKPPINLAKKDMVTMTLVNMRKSNSNNSEILTTIKGGETVNAEIHDYGDFKKVTYKGREGYINKKYLR